MKRVISLFFFLILSYHVNAETTNPDIVIGVADPFVYNIDNGTLIIKNNLIFELYTFNETEHLSFKILDNDNNTIDAYLNNSKSNAINEECDYVLVSETYSMNDMIFIYMRLINPYDDTVLCDGIYSIDLDIKINEHLSTIASDFFNKLVFSKLKNNAQKKMNKIQTVADNDKKNESDVLFTFKNYLKHELFFMNGFFKNTSDLYTLISVYTGYAYYLSDSFFIDTGITGGIGRLTNDFLVNDFSVENYYSGGFIGIHFYIQGVCEPNLGLRAELLYYSNNSLIMSLPIDVGLKIFISQKHVIRLNTSFPITTYDILNNKWSKKITLGIIVGYGFKL